MIFRISLLLLLMAFYLELFSDENDFKPCNYIVLDIDSVNIHEYYIIVLRNSEKLECESFLISSKSDTIKIDTNYRLIEIGDEIRISLQLSNEIKSNRKSLKMNGKLVKIDGLYDSLHPFYYGLPPCEKMIWKDGYFTNTVFTSNEIVGLYIKSSIFDVKMEKSTNIIPFIRRGALKTTR